MKSRQLQLIFLACFFIICNPAYSQDTDADGIADTIDVDDDNDGILDAVECPDLGKAPLLNADFEDLDIISSGTDDGPSDVIAHLVGIWKGDASNIPNWESADPINNYLEIWHNSHVPVDDVGGVAYSGTHWAEINASTNDGLYQDITTTGGDVLQWSFAHRKRTGFAGSATEDIARLLIGDPTGPLTSMGDFSSANDASWTVHSGTYTVPAGQTTTRLTFTWVNSVSGSSSSGNFVDTVQLFIIPNCQDTDGDTIPDYIDIDSDNDGIPDNVEAQTTAGYILPSGTVNASGTYAGLWNNYGTGLSSENTDGTDEVDYLDSDSDNDGIPDIQENGMANTFTAADADNDGLKNVFETTGVNDPSWDENEDIHNPSDLSILPDTDGDLVLGGDLDYRDVVDVYYSSATIDFDGIDDYVSTPSFMSGYPNATMMAWIKLDATFSAAGDIAGHAMMRMYVDSTRKIRSYYITNASNSAYGSLAPASLALEQWYHVAITYEGATGAIKIYVNGQLEAQSTIPSGTLSVNPSFTSHDFNIGRHSRLSNSHFKGDIDEVRVFSKVLTDAQLKRMVYQEIEQNGASIKGAVLPNNIDENLSDPILWSDLEAYYPMTDILTGFKTNDFSAKGRTAILNNITTVQDQTAPMPYQTKADGDWSTEATWLHGDVWDIEDEPSNKDWSIVKVHHNISTSKSHTTLGLFIDSTKTLSVNGDNAITNNWYLELNGTLDLADDSQLIQGTNSDLVTSATGKILRRQEGHSNVYWYNYWSSPTGALNATSLLDNNAATNNPNNTPYSVKMLKQDDGSDVSFTTAFSPPLTNPVTLSSKWLYTFQNGLNYYDWTALDQNTAIAPGLGYTQKGTGNAGPSQQYIFEGKPNNGTILVNAIDTGGPGSVVEVSKTTTFIGNPYPSALDARQFINDNSSVIEGTIKLWEQWAGNSHWLSEYEGGYGYINLLTNERAYQYPGIPIAGQVQTQGIKVPSFYLPVGQAFHVEVITDGDIVFNNGQRIFKKEADAGADPEDGSVFFAPVPNDDDNDLLDAPEALSLEEEQKPMQLIRLEFKASNGASRRFVLGFGEHTTDGYDYGYDGGVIDNIPDEDMASLFNGQSYVLQALSNINPEKVVDLSFKASGIYSYSLEIAELIHVDDTQQIYLRDHQENSIWDLRQGAYNFSALEGKDDDRFDIVFKSEERPSSNEQAVNEPVITIMEFDNKLFVKGLTEQVNSLRLKNMLGQTIKTFSNLENQALENGLHLGDLSSGVYLVELITEGNIQINKKILLE